MTPPLLQPNVGIVFFASGMRCDANMTEAEISALSVPGWSKAVESAALLADRSSTRGSGGAPSGWASPWELYQATR